MELFISIAYWKMFVLCAVAFVHIANILLLMTHKDQQALASYKNKFSMTLFYVHTVVLTIIFSFVYGFLFSVVAALISAMVTNVSSFLLSKFLPKLTQTQLPYVGGIVFLLNFLLSILIITYFI